MQKLRCYIFSVIAAMLLLVETGCAATHLLVMCTPQQKEVDIPRENWNECFKRPFSHAGITHSVFCLNNGSAKPPVLLLHELPGLSPGTLAYAEELSKDFTVYVPLLFGKKGESLVWNGYRAYWFRGPADFSPSGEWGASPQGSVPVVTWLRGVVQEIEKQHQNQRIGIIGNCMTGAFPLALLDNPRVGAAVVAQPALPMSFFFCPTESDKQSLGLSKIDEDAMRKSTAKIYGVRFEGDCIANSRKHQWLKETLHARFEDGEIKEEDYQENNERTRAHSTLIGSWKAPGKLGDASKNTRRHVRDFLCQELGNRCPKE